MGIGFGVAYPVTQNVAGGGVDPLPNQLFQRLVSQFVPAGSLFPTGSPPTKLYMFQVRESAVSAARAPVGSGVKNRPYELA